jgi:H+/Cl- antiporter ClcA
MADAPDQTKKVVAIAGTFAAFSMVFSSPLLAAIILIEAIGLGGATLPLILIPGLVAAGVGSIVYLGASNLSGLSTSAYALSPLDLPAMGDLSPAALGWTVALAVATPVAGFVIIQIGQRLEGPVKRRPFVVVPVAGLVVGGLAIVFAQTTGQPEYAVLFSGSRALSPLVAQATTLSLATLALLFVLKGLAWGISMGSFRGGPVFPAIFIGTVGGLLAAHLPGFSEGAGVAVVMAALLASVLRLPLSSVIIATVLTSSTGPQALPLIIIAVVISYIITLRLFDRSETAREVKESGGLASVPAASRGD